MLKCCEFQFIFHFNAVKNKFNTKLHITNGIIDILYVNNIPKLYFKRIGLLNKY